MNATESEKYPQETETQFTPCTIKLRCKFQILPFDSNRKCMSVLVRHPLTNEVVLYSKGADSTILSSLSSQEDGSVTTSKIRQHLQSYARQGLRTLVMAKKSLTVAEYEAWRQTHTEAELAMENRELRIKNSYASLESHLTVLGATGIDLHTFN